MSAEPKIVQTLYCSFCSKSQYEVRKMIAGPKVFICDECVELCSDIIVEETAISHVKAEMKKRGEIIITQAEADRIAWMRTGEFVPSGPTALTAKQEAKP